MGIARHSELRGALGSRGWLARAGCGTLWVTSDQYGWAKYREEKRNANPRITALEVLGPRVMKSPET